MHAETWDLHTMNMRSVMTHKIVYKTEIQVFIEIPTETARKQ